MQLPPVLIGKTPVRLPLSFAGAWETLALLHFASGQAETAWEATLRKEPSLLLWTVFQMHLAGTAAPVRVSDSAAWLTFHALPLFADEGENSSHTPPRSPGAPTRPLELTAAAQYIGQSAGRLCLDQQHRGQAELFGLCHNVCDWLAESSSSGDDLRDQMPPWLDQLLRRLSAQSAPFPAEAAVIQAIQQLHTPSQDAAPAESSCSNHGLSWFLACAEDRWHAASDSAPNLIAAAARHLLELRSLKAEFQQEAHRQKMESLAELAYGATHEINNPLANISTRAQTLLVDEADPERRRALATIHGQAMRAHEMIAGMMLFARPPQPEVEKFDLSALLQGILQELSAEAEAQDTQMSCNRASPLALVADPRQLAVAIKALLRNSLESLERGGQVQIVVETAKREDAVEITVSNNGPPIDERSRKHLFDPFYSGREAGRGLGFGLSCCWRIVAAHKGTIEVENLPDRGVAFRIRLPQLAAPAN